MQNDAGHIWSMIESPTESNEETSFLSYLRNSVVSVNRENTNNINIRIIDLVSSLTQTLLVHKDVTSTEASRALKNLGIYHEDNYLYFSISNEQLKEVFKSKPMYRDFGQMLVRIPGTKRLEKRKRLEGQLLTVVEMPLDTFLNDSFGNEVDEDVPF